MVRMSMVLWLVLAVGSSAAPPPVQREAAVQAVSMGVSGAAVTSVTARIASNRAGVPSVGIVEELPSGSGEQWLLTLWQSALVATQATEASLLSFEFSLRVGGAIDRTSAGLLTASTLAALIKNKKVIPNTTITGSINPDGSAGPIT
jgi:predicted S18 family serine protease